MRHIAMLIEKAVAATAESCKLQVQFDGIQYHASVVNLDGSVITLESDWSVLLENHGPTLATAIANLDAICAADFS